MDAESYRELKALEEISANGRVTQRHLAKQLRVALGLTNLMIRRLVKKGYVQLTNAQKTRIHYLITPRGIEEKTRLTYEFLEYSFFLFRRLRGVLREHLARLADSGCRDIVIIGTGEIAEIAYLTLKEFGLNLAGVFDERAAGTPFLGLSVQPPSALAEQPFDCAIVCPADAGSDGAAALRALGVPNDKILMIECKATDIRAVLPTVEPAEARAGR